MISHSILPKRPDQLIVNGSKSLSLPFAVFTANASLEYQPGQGISKHIDKVNLFEERIVSISLGSGCTMDFERGNTKEGSFDRALFGGRVCLTFGCRRSLFGS